MTTIRHVSPREWFYRFFLQRAHPDGWVSECNHVSQLMGSFDSQPSTELHCRCLPCVLFKHAKCSCTSLIAILSAISLRPWCNDASGQNMAYFSARRAFCHRLHLAYLIPTHARHPSPPPPSDGLLTLWCRHGSVVVLQASRARNHPLSASNSRELLETTIGFFSLNICFPRNLFLSCVIDVVALRHKFSEELWYNLGRLPNFEFVF